MIRLIAHYPDAELRTAKDGQYVKVSGVGIFVERPNHVTLLVKDQIM